MLFIKRMAVIKLHNVKKREKGSAAVEFALCLPILILIFCGIVEYGWYLTNWMVLTNAVSAGARAGIKARDWKVEEDPAQFAKNAAKDAFWLRSLTGVKVDIIKATQKSPRKIEVRVDSFEYWPLTGFLPPGFLPEYLRAKAVMVFP